MKKITKEEFYKNFDLYNDLAQKEEIVICSNGKELYTLIPQNIYNLSVFKSMVGKLPNDATIGIDPNERD